MKQNCWGFKKCGREYGGTKSQELGVCPASVEEKADGVNCGKNGGRVCWALTGTMCGGTIQGEFAKKQTSCMSCDFFKKVQKEEGVNFHLMLPGQKYHKPERG